MVFFFFFFITHHSSLNFLHLSLVTQNTPVSYTHPFGTHYSTCHHSKFSIFCGSHTCNLVRTKLLAYPRKVSSPFFLFSHFLFPLQPTYSPKAQTPTHNSRRSSLADLHHSSLVSQGLSKQAFTTK